MTSDDQSRADDHARRRRRRRLLLWALAAWAIAAYLVVPEIWKTYFRHHSDFDAVARITTTADGHPGDPVNVALVGSEADVVHAMTAAGWTPADEITLRTSLRIVADSVLSRPDDDAPVSDLYLFGRKQDLAFERPIGDNPRKRHHVRFWRWDKLEDGRPAWFGSATLDERVGLSYTTGQVTHHIGPDVDAERALIASTLSAAGYVLKEEWVNGFHKQLEGRNGGGDRWHTDGRLEVVVLRDRPAAPEGAAGK